MKNRYLLSLLCFLIFTGSCFYNRHAVIKLSKQPLADGFYALPNSPKVWNAEILYPLGEACDKYEVVGLGEAHHTSAGFYKAKAAVIKFLITQKSFRAIAFEDNWNTARAINEYVLGSTNDPKAALLSLSHTVWHAESILDLIIWIRNYNDMHSSDKVVFFGFDMQDYQYAQKYLNGKENFYREIAKKTVSAFEERAQARQRVNPEDRYEGDACVRIRDQAMAEIFLEMKSLMAPHKKTIIWAANAHIAKEDNYKSMQISMGYFLYKKIPEKYAAFVIVASEYETYAPWRSLIPMQKEAPKGSLEEWLESFGYDSLFVDFRKVTPQLMNISKEEFETFNPFRWANGAVYLRYSEPMNLVHF